MQRASAAKRRGGGFTLIELMVALVIVGILAAIAIPNYSRYVIRGNRADAQQFMLTIANTEERYLLDNRGYASDIATLGLSMPSRLNGLYSTPVITVGTTPPTFLITVTPVAGSAQASDGALTLDNTGAKTGTWN